MPGKILISSCLLGMNTRYDGKSKTIDDLVHLVKTGKAIFVCPEQLGGFSTPRDPAEIEPGKTATDVLAGQGKVITKAGEDITAQFIQAAKQTLELCKKFGIRAAVLHANSPTCGSQKVYDGSFTGNTIIGRGITAELLSQNGIKVFDETNYYPGAICGHQLKLKKRRLE